MALVFSALMACKGDSDKPSSSSLIQSNKFVHTTDIDHFWEAYDQIKKTEDYSAKLQLINSLYIDRGTEGLMAFMKLRNYTDTVYVELIEDLPLFWNSIRNKTLSVKLREQEINQSIEKLRELYPDLKPAKIYFTIGGMRSGGTVEGSKSLIGCEIAMGDKEVDISEFKDHGHEWLIPFFQLQNASKLVEMNVHEYVHTQQKNMGMNVLTQALHEGSCDFITELVTQKSRETHYMRYGKANEPQLKKDFFRDVFIKEYNNWFYDSNSRYNIQDLGYFMGYAICKAYYDQAENKRIAIKQIIELDHSNLSEVIDFTNSSGYFDQLIGSKEQVIFP